MGNNVPYLRDMAGLGQVIVYIRPIQKDLDESEAAVSVGVFTFGEKNNDLDSNYQLKNNNKDKICITKIMVMMG